MIIVRVFKYLACVKYYVKNLNICEDVWLILWLVYIRGNWSLSWKVWVLYWVIGVVGIRLRFVKSY